MSIGTFCVGEFWADLRYNHDGLEYDQNGPRQSLVNYIEGTGNVLPLFDFPTKGILQVCALQAECCVDLILFSPRWVIVRFE